MISLSRSVPFFGGLSSATSVNLKDRGAGCLVGGLCGDVLGSKVEGHPSEAIVFNFPEGLTNFQDHRRGYGKYTDDTEMTIALAKSLIRTGGVCDARDAAASYVSDLNIKRGYGKTARAILLKLAQGEDYRTSGSLFFEAGSFANGGAMRIAPVGIVYRDASIDELEEAVKAALLCTHIHPVGIEGAFIQAAAVALLMHREPVGEPAHFLEQLMSIASEGGEMKGKIDTIARRLASAPPFADGVRSIPTGLLNWSIHLQSERWFYERETMLQISEPFQIRATDAVATALMAMCFYWNGRPSEAVIAAVHYGGDADTTAAMCGNLVGALHGMQWIREAGWWIEGLEAKDLVKELGEKLVDLERKPSEGKDDGVQVHNET